MSTVSVSKAALLVLAFTLAPHVSQAWTYYSSMEAITEHTATRLCLGECAFHSGIDQCVFAWNRSMTRCHNTGRETLRYRTLTNNECYSNCGKFDEESYEWCTVKGNNWDYCTRRLALKGISTVSTPSIYAVCKDSCSKRGYSYYWCNDVDDGWQYCDPTDHTHVFDYPTEDNSTCAGQCRLYGDHSKPYCYTKERSWQRCYLNPSYDHTLNVIDYELHDKCYFSQYNTPGGLETCKKDAPEVHNVRKRAPDDYENNELYFECDSAVTDVLALHMSRNPTVVVRQPNPNNMITTNRDPILSYTLLPIPSYFTDDYEVQLPLALQALLTSHTLLPRGTDRDHFTSDVDRNFNAMDRTLTHVNYDERGHILASRLGGPMRRYNMFPQAWRLNRGQRSLWFGMETDLYNFLENNTNRYVTFTAVLSYATDDNHVLVQRPSAIMVQVRAYENGVNIDLYNRRPVDPVTNPSTTENIFFSNDPNHACEPLPAQNRNRG